MVLTSRVSEIFFEYSFGQILQIPNYEFMANVTNFDSYIMLLNLVVLLMEAFAIVTDVQCNEFRGKII